ncbi:MAG: hypothetical protein PHO32_00385 [Candidatus Cloacimonetes bacterium]|nr:hypothetical protein [Candidatus Cloacimonadota bacterium]
MRILLAKPKPLEEAELLEYFSSMNCYAKTVNNRSELCNVLDSQEIDIVLFNASTVDDFAQIRYINDNYPTVKVIVSLETSLGNAVENVRNGSYQAIRRPFHLNDLDACITSNFAIE